MHKLFQSLKLGSDLLKAISTVQPTVVLLKYIILILSVL